MQIENFNLHWQFLDHNPLYYTIIFMAGWLAHGRVANARAYNKEKGMVALDVFVIGASAQAAWNLRR
jgi:hypothetical protein